VRTCRQEEKIQQFRNDHSTKLPQQLTNSTSERRAVIRRSREDVWICHTCTRSHRRIIRRRSWKLLRNLPTSREIAWGHSPCS
jgi:hypothetical protein